MALGDDRSFFFDTKRFDFLNVESENCTNVSYPVIPFQLTKKGINTKKQARVNSPRLFFGWLSERKLVVCNIEVIIDGKVDGIV